jgi:hypothetical protein
MPTVTRTLRPLPLKEITTSTSGTPRRKVREIKTGAELPNIGAHTVFRPVPPKEIAKEDRMSLEPIQVTGLHAEGRTQTEAASSSMNRQQEGASADAGLSPSKISELLDSLPHSSRLPKHTTPHCDSSDFTCRGCNH